jgi:beta-alanine--pyruvate transaminase
MSEHPTRNDLTAFWMPFTGNRSFQSHPRFLDRAEGMHYFKPDGSPVLDGTSGLWCVNAGHCRKPIAEAIAAQAARLDFAPTFQVGHPIAVEFASRLTEILPPRLNRIFFTNSGSESADTALKIALAYQQAIGEKHRTRLIGRQRGYHGVGFGGISVGGIENNRRAFALLPDVDHLCHTYNPETCFLRGQPEIGADLAEDLERLIALHGAETIAAVIVEPLAGSTGVLPPPKGYLERLREITERHRILLIFDEVITAFGRLGAATASELFNVTPDILTMAKGLTNAAVPMGAVALDARIQEAIFEAADPGIELFHGYTYSGHPLAAAAGLAALDLFADEDLFARAAATAAPFEEAVHSFRGVRHVRDVRNLGLVAGIELEPRAGAPGTRAMEAFHACLDDGVLIRVTGDIIALSPPLIVSREQIDEMVGKLAAVLGRLN